MADLKISAAWDAAGRLIIGGSGLEELLAGAEAAELWHTPSDQGLAVHFVAAGPAKALPLLRDPDDPQRIVIEAGAHLKAIKTNPPRQEEPLLVGSLDIKRKVLVLKPTTAPRAGLTIDSVLQDYSPL